MADKTINDLVAISNTNIARTNLFEVQRGSTTPTEKLALGDLMDNYIAGKRYVAGRIYAPVGHVNEQANTSAAVSGTAIYCLPFFLPEDITINNMYVRTAGTVGTTPTGHFGICSLVASTFKPDAKLGETLSTIAMGSTTTNYTAALTANLTLKRGWYGFLNSFSATGSHMMVGPTPGLVPGILSVLGGSSIANAFGTTNTTTAWECTSGFTYGTIPSDLTTLTWADHTTGRSASFRFEVASVP